MSIRIPQPVAAPVGSVLHMPALEMLQRQRDKTAGLICSDPPFFIGIGRADHWKAGQLGNDPWTKESVNSHRSAADWYVPIAQEAMRVLRPGGSIAIMGGSQSIAAWEDAAAFAGLRWMAEITVLWNTGKPRQRNFGSLSMPIRWYIRPGGRYAWETEALSLYSNVIVCSKVPVKDRMHPAQKPVELTNFLVSLLSLPGDIVIDPFCGSGSTLVSAAMCERSFIGSDLERENCDIAIGRTGQLDDEAAMLRPIYFWINNRLEEI